MDIRTNCEIKADVEEHHTWKSILSAINEAMKEFPDDKWFITSVRIDAYRAEITVDATKKR